MDFFIKLPGGSPSPSSPTSYSTPHHFKSASTPTVIVVAENLPLHRHRSRSDAFLVGISLQSTLSHPLSLSLSLSHLFCSDSHSEKRDINLISSLADFDRPALLLLSSRAAYPLISSSLCNPASDSGSDIPVLCV